MPSKVRSACYETVRAITPGGCNKCWLHAAEVFRVGHLISRKFRALKGGKNNVAYAFGAGLEAVAGKLPGVQAVSKVVFGTLSTLKCSEDLIELNRLSKRCRLLFSGKGYILVKKNNWVKIKGCSALLTDRFRWFRYVTLVQIKLGFETIGAIFKRVFLLALHLSDVYAAFKYKHVSEVFIYSKQLWKKLSSNRSRLAQELKKSKKVADSMLSKTGSSWTASFLLTIVTLPIKVKQKLPARRDMEISLAKTWQGLEERMEASHEFYKNREQKFFHKKIMGRSYAPPVEKKYRVFQKGTVEDADFMRFIQPPNKKMGLKY